MDTEMRPKLKVGKHYQIYDGWLDWKGDGKYIGKRNDEHVFVIGEGKKKGYAIIPDQFLMKEVIITHPSIAPSGFAFFHKENIANLGNEEKSELIKILKELGERI